VEEEEEEAPADPAPDNLLVNKALLKTVGLDTAAELSASLAGVLASPSTTSRRCARSFCPIPRSPGSNRRGS
jgi:hypothetical protein